jgi:hypothetical protein
MTSASGLAGASCLSADCGGTPEGLEAPGGSLPDDDLRGYCSTCRFWLAKAGQAVPGTVVADMGDGARHQFYFNPAEPIVYTGNPSLHLGFGGTPWRVRFFGGRVVETNDLYGHGEIPARFHHLFPPNATLEQLGGYGGRRFDNGPPFHLLVHLEFPARDLTVGTRPSVASGSAAAGELTADQLARATAALDAWFDPGPGGYRAPGARVTWDQLELESMHAALEAPTIDAALEAFPGAPGTALSTPEQDAENRALMTGLRLRLGRGAPPDPAARERLGQDVSPGTSRPAAAASTQRRRPARPAQAAPGIPRARRP